MDLDPRLRQQDGDYGDAPPPHYPRATGGRLSESNSPQTATTPASYPAPPPPPSSRYTSATNPGPQHSHTPSTEDHRTPESQHSHYPPPPTSIIARGLGESDNDHPPPSRPDPNNPADDAKRARACEACRGLKVRCEPDPDDGPCKRCKKAGRSCVVTMPSRKRAKKTDSRVAELEKKIDALTASLQARAQGGGGSVSQTSIAGAGNGAVGGAEWSHSPQGTRSPDARNRNSVSAGDHLILGTGIRAATFPHISPVDRLGAERRMSGLTPGSDAFAPPLTAGQKRKASERSEHDGFWDDQRPNSPPRPSLIKAHEGDIVDRRLITIEKAADLFAQYNQHLVPHLPAVVFPPGYTVAELRSTKPTLFLAIMAAASSETPDLQKAMQRDLMHCFADKIIIRGDKSLEIVQALQVAVIWYWPPEHFEELKFYQLVHIGAVMAIDIGLGRKLPSRKGMTFGGANPFSRKAPLDPTSMECRRAWLTCHFLSSNTSMALHRPQLIRWTPFMSECVKILETSPTAAPTDQYLCRLIWSHRHAEDIGAQFSMDDLSVTVDVTDSRIQFAMKAFEREMERYVASVPSEELQPSFKISYNVVSLYMHEMSLHYDNMGEGFRSPANPDSTKPENPLSSAQINALTQCIYAIDGIFTTFLGLDIPAIRCLPVFNFVRIAYGVVILLKMYFSASSPDSELGKVITKENMQVEYYLESLINKFRDAAADDKCRPAAKFLVVLAMLRGWFVKQGKQESEKIAARARSQSEAIAGTLSPHPSVSSSGTPKRPPSALPQQQQQSQLGPSSTPLHLLSEVAAGTDSNRNVMGGSRGSVKPSPFLGARPYFTTNTPTSPDDPSNTLPPITMAAQHLATSGGTAAGMNSPGMPPSIAAPFPQPQAWGGAQPPIQHSVPPQVMGMNVPVGSGGMPTWFDIDPTLMMGVPDGYEGNAEIVMQEPWFNDIFQGPLDPKLFPF